jgi:hypothetical protein
MVGSSFIYSLCVGLAHKWEPDRFFMIFTFYLDESGTHEKEPTIIMAGVLGHAYQWRRFEKKLEKIRKKYGFKILHAKHLKKRTGEFRNWSGEKCMGLIREITELVEKTLTEGCVVALPYEVYRDGYKSTPFPKGMNPDSQYGLCFRACMAQVMPIVETSGKKPHLHVVIEDGHKNVGDTSRIFNEIKKIYNEHGFELLGTITQAKKDEALPLMVADFLAHTYALMREGGEEWKKNRTNKPPGVKIARGKAGLTYLEIAPNGLEKLKGNFLKLKELRQDNWRKKKTTSSSQSS